MENLLSKKISSVGGTEVLGIDLSIEQSAEVLQGLRKICIDSSFLLLRNQDITFNQQLSFAKSFGNALGDNLNSPDQKGTFVTSSGEIELHFDHWLTSNFPEPIHFTMLYAMEVVTTGGETTFTNAKKAYEDLPDELKLQINDLKALHCYNYSYSDGKKPMLRTRDCDISPDQPRAIHSIVRVHPNTGEKTLYVSPRNTDRIIGLGLDESEALLNKLWRYFRQSENIYSHKWQIGDLLIWDNHAMLHGRKDYDSTQRRQLRRICIL